LIIVVIAHLVWFFERRHPWVLNRPSYYPGILEAGWWAASTLATQADQMPRTALARIVAVMWMFASVVFIAYFTASVTSSLTLQRLRGDINGPDDLPGKRVASVQGSTSAEYLRQHHIQATEFSRVEEAFEALEHGQTDAIVYDAPILLFYASHEGKVQLGSIFARKLWHRLSNEQPLPAGERSAAASKRTACDQLYRVVWWFELPPRRSSGRRG
jgi:polar amino acid transport system substrate-binding protein